MNNSLVNNNPHFLYRLELIGCNIAIQTLGRFSSLRTWIQRGAHLVADQAFPYWLASMVVSGIVGMMGGFSLYCFLVLAR